jgi:hypothetical protein
MFNDAIPFKMPAWIMLIITVWFEASELERIAKGYLSHDDIWPQLPLGPIIGWFNQKII